MTGEVSHPTGRLDVDRVPAVCPICGHRNPMPFDLSMQKHLRGDHRDRLGRAKLNGTDRWREFAAVGPSFGREGSMDVLWIDFPFGVDKVERDRFVIEWAADGRRVPVNEGGRG